MGRRSTEGDDDTKENREREGKRGERERERERETLIWLVKKVSFLKIFPPSLESSSWCSESILKIRLYLLYLFLLVQVGGLRFQTFVYQQKLSFRSISNIFLEQWD